MKLCILYCPGLKAGVSDQPATKFSIRAIKIDHLSKVTLPCLVRLATLPYLVMALYLHTQK